MDPESTPLARAADWTLWWTAFKTMAQNLHVWQYIDPKCTHELNPPAFPDVPKELDGTPSLVSGAVLLNSKEESYQRALRHFTGVTMPVYSAKMDRYALDRQSLHQMETFFASTVSRKVYGPLFATKHTLRDKVRSLLNKVEPSTDSEMEDAYFALDDLLDKNPADVDFGSWSSKIRLALTRWESLQRTFPDVAHQVRDAHRLTKHKTYTQNTGMMPEHKDLLTGEPMSLDPKSQPPRLEPAENVYLIDVDIEPLPQQRPVAEQTQQSTVSESANPTTEQPAAQPRHQRSTLSAKAAPFELSKAAPTTPNPKETDLQPTLDKSAAASTPEKELAPTVFQLAAEDGEHVEKDAGANTATRRATSPPRGRGGSTKSASLASREADHDLTRHIAKRPACDKASERGPPRPTRESSAPPRTVLPSKTPFPPTTATGTRRPSALVRRSSLSPKRDATNANAVAIGRRRLPSLPLSTSVNRSSAKRKLPSTWEYRERCEWCNFLHVPEGEVDHWRSCYYCIPQRCPPSMRHILRDPKRVDAVHRKLSRYPKIERAIRSFLNDESIDSWRKEREREADPVDLVHSDSSYTAYSTENYKGPRSRSRPRNLDYDGW